MAHQRGQPIRVVARKTGLTVHVIRVWEKRYAAVSPARTPTNRRLYADTDVERLHLLRRATLTGHSIGQIAHLPTERLRALLAADAMIAPMRPTTIGSALADSSPLGVLEACFAAVATLDSAGLEETLRRAAVIFSLPACIEQVIVPLMHRIGDLWYDGTLHIAHEHLTSAVVRTLLGSLSRGFAPAPSGPSLVVTTPAGQLHELGALAVAVTAASDGWDVTYMGPSLPAEEIASAAHQRRARAVALSLVYPDDDPYLRGELVTLRRSVAAGVKLLVGGRASDAYSGVLDEVGAVRLTGLAEFRKQLEVFCLNKPHRLQEP